jgi:tetratricopeptide (TPR) repeat protein
VTGQEPDPVPAPVDRSGRLDPDALALLEDERDFLLRSLDDLEREHEAGDVDAVDYQTLRDDYTARAAAVLRAIEAGRARFESARPSRSRGRTFAWVAGVVAFAVLAGVLVTQSTGRRDPGGFITGDIRRSATENLNRAGGLLQQGRYEDAVEVYDEVLVEQPANPEALAYRGWALTLAGDREAGLVSLIEAATTEPDYPDAHAFLAVVFLRSGLVDQAERELEILEGLDPPASVRELVEPLRDQIDARRAAADPGS